MEAAGLSVALDGTPVLHDVTLPVRAGELLVLAGPNGAGKSTLLGALAGDLAPTAGCVRLAGADVRRLRADELARRRSVMPQDHRVAFSFRVRQLVEMGRAPWRRTPRADEDDALVDAALAAADVPHLADRLYPTLSGGERARTAFARTLAQDCPVLLLDEPTAALDVQHQERLLAHTRSLTRGGAAAVAVLHDLNLAAGHADRVALLAGGRLRALGTPAEVLTADLLSEVYEHPIDVLPHPVGGGPLVLPRRPSHPEDPR
nr:heme ABC transporter ATP-binding protein [Modestobacter versicolor]